VTNPSDPKAPKSSRKKSAREPATIDLKATVVDAGAKPDVPAPEDPPVAGAERAPETGAAEPAVSVDSGLGTDSIAAGTLPEDVSPHSPPPLDTPFRDTLSTDDTLPKDDTLAQDALPQDVPAPGISVSDATSHDAPPQEPPPPEETVRHDAPQDPVPPPAPPARRSSVGAMIGSGLLGGLVGAGLMYGLQQARPASRTQDDSRLAQLEQRVAAVSQQGGGQGSVNIQPLDQRISALETAQASVDQRVQAAQAAAEQAAARAEEALNRPAPAAGPQTDPAVGQLTERVTGLDNQVQASLQQVQQLQTGLQQVQQLQADLQQVRSDIQAAAGARQASEGRVAELDRRLADQDRRASEQEKRLEDLSRQAAERAEAGRPTVRVVLAERLGDALRNGEPYPEVLAALRGAQADPGRVTAIEPFAQQGAPTAAELAQSFEPLSAAMLRDERTASGDWTDRLLRMADKVVTIRPVNAPDSTSASGLVARIEQALARGDVGDAAKAWEALPEPARRMSEDWGRQAKARADADAAAQAIAADALSALNRTTQ
jgi:hypothetical protein